MRSTVDGSELALRVVERGELKTATMRVPARLLERQAAFAVVDVIHGDTPVCNQTARTRARSLTPATCEVTAKMEDEPSEDENHAQLARVTAARRGAARLGLRGGLDRARDGLRRRVPARERAPPLASQSSSREFAGAVTGPALYSWSLYWILRGETPRMLAAFDVEPPHASSVRRIA